MIPNGNTPILQCTTPRAFYEEIITINLQLTGKSCLMVELRLVTQNIPLVAVNVTNAVVA